ncbi:MAG: LysM peptidoglycan-binding domain-containing protein [Xanthobacteraceae bacterium]
MVQWKKMRVVVTALTAVLIAARLVTTTQAQPSTSVENVHGRAYLFYGLIPAIDWGMDQLAQRINRSGVAASANAHSSWRIVADQAISDYRRNPKPIAVVGHSIGGDSAVQFAQALGAAHVPVSLLITYDATRATDGSVPANVHRYINLYQSSNILGGGDLTPGSGFRGHYASYNLKDRSEIIHVNLDKFSRIQELLAAKIRSMGEGEAEAVPIRVVFAATGPIELWDDGMAVSAHAGDTLHSLADMYHVPVWALAQLNRKSENAALNEGERVIVPRYLGQRIASRSASPNAAKPPSDEEPKPKPGEDKTSQ